MKYFINYATEEFKNSQNLGLSSASNFGFFTKGYNQRDLDSKFIIENINILSRKRGAGYWLWKPYIILDMLSKINNGDFLVYMDSGANFIGDPERYLSDLDDKGVLSFSMVQKTSKWTKGDCFYEINKEKDYEFSEKNQLLATYIFFKKCNFCVDFVKDWLELCKKENLITDDPNIHMENLEDFIDHRHDQSIFSLLGYNREVKIIPQIDQYCVEHGLDINRRIINRHGIRN